MVTMGGSYPPFRSYMVLADGENLVFRYQDMLPTRVPNAQTVHIEDVFVWHPGIVAQGIFTPVRLNYYTSATGGDDYIEQLEDKISTNVFSMNQVCPRVFKKPAKSKKAKLVDISICIDAMRHSNNKDVQVIFLLSGDGDYLPLIKEVMRNGTQVWLGAFSNGLSPKLKPAVDRFVDLDRVFFKHDQNNNPVHPKPVEDRGVLG